ncbi:MAG: sigma-70 family RNA polymerase sigma factor [Defluviitaleaceae bacterium]|nr:sigma-70 family RNA polymerase sigma factor [Defluviitaleaceae bacterium]
MSYEALQDEHLASLATTGDTGAQDALLARYKNFVKKAVRPYFIIGADHEDLVQEGMIGLYKAIREYRSTSTKKEASFASFAAACIKNQILTAIKNASRKKHSPLNTYISIHQDNPEILHITDPAADPAQALLHQEAKTAIQTLSASLSPLESAILTHFLSGLSYAEIAEKIDATTKSVDNALSRIRRKAAKLLNSAL